MLPPTDIQDLRADPILPRQTDLVRICPPALVAVGVLPGLAAACASEPAGLNAAPCYEQYRAIPLDQVTAMGLAPQDAVGRYAKVFTDVKGRERTVDVRLRRPDTGWVRDIVRDARYGYTETPSCDIRVGVELEIEVETGEQWFAEAFHGAAVRSEFQDAWLVRALRPLGHIEGKWPEERGLAPCEDVDIGFSLFLDDSTSGGSIVERQPGTSVADDACYREIMAWDLDVD